MTIQEAIVEAREKQPPGVKSNAIKRLSWKRDTFLFVSPHNGHRVYNEDGSDWRPRAADLLADDWEALDDVPPPGPIRPSEEVEY